MLKQSCTDGAVVFLRSTRWLKVLLSRCLRLQLHVYFDGNTKFVFNSFFKGQRLVPHKLRCKSFLLIQHVSGDGLQTCLENLWDS